jgi:hypothetical protein
MLFSLITLANNLQLKRDLTVELFPHFHIIQLATFYGILLNFSSKIVSLGGEHNQ